MPRFFESVMQVTGACRIFHAVFSDVGPLSCEIFVFAQGFTHILSHCFPAGSLCRMNFWDVEKMVASPKHLSADSLGRHESHTVDAVVMEERFLQDTQSLILSRGFEKSEHRPRCFVLVRVHRFHRPISSKGDYLE